MPVLHMTGGTGSECRLAMMSHLESSASNTNQSKSVLLDTLCFVVTRLMHRNRQCADYVSYDMIPTRCRLYVRCAMQDAVYYAYFAPYSYERHQDLIAKSTSNKQVRLEVLGETLDGHDIDLLQIGKKLF